jgi:allantoicase
VSDEFFAPAANLLTPTAPISKPGVFVETGAWYDGWESRRHNRNEYDYVVIRLGVAAGLVRGVEIDTAFFTGNHGPIISVEGCYVTESDANTKVAATSFDQWTPILPRKPCQPSTRHAWTVQSPAVDRPVTHVRLRQYPDGGIARFRLYGLALPVWPDEKNAVVEVSAAVNGGLALAASDQHYGTAANLLLPGRGKDMGDGWETKRSRAPGHVDWAIIKFGAAARVQRIVVDTMHFRGNFPREVNVHLANFSAAADGRDAQAKEWVQAVHHQAMNKDTEFEFSMANGLAEVVEGKVWTHAKLTMIPDGGVKRLRVFGTRVEA